MRFVRFGLLLTLVAAGACRPAAKEAAMSSTAPARPAAQNRLRDATSPYLQQHAGNPVEWYEWGAEALETARRENKPIFLSIGYSACHWCHVMAHESFEDAEIAAVMNRHFVNIKVDREERPDIDEIYMQATMIMNRGQGGWPMSVWMTPELQPFFAGTYFPPNEKWGRPGFRQLCERIGEFWATKQEALRADAAKLSEMVRESLSTTGGEGAAITLEHIDKTVDLLAGVFDTTHGGMSGGGTNKFPPSMALDLMLRSARRGDDPARRERLESLVRLTLDQMAAGGIYDQLGGGIHRYSTDVEWLVPHFEKMLYDQALVSRIYVDAFQYFGDPRYADVARDMFEYVLRDLQSPEGGFYSTRDADSEGEEGRYYVWTKAEVEQAVGREGAPLVCDYFDVRETGNWDDPHAPGVPKSVLHVPREIDVVAKLHQLEVEEAKRRIEGARRKLLDARAKRVAPGRDEKILAEWNGMMISSLARGGAALGEQRFIDAAARAADFVLTKQMEGGRLLRSYRDGRRLEAAFLTDYACMIDGLIELYEATFERRWLDAAVELNATAIRLFNDAERGGFFFTASDHEKLLARSKDVRDSATPSGNSVQLMNLLRLADLLGDASLREQAERTVHCFAAEVLAQPGTSERFMAGAEFGLGGATEIVFAGRFEDPATRELLRVAYEAYLPNRVMTLVDPEQPEAAPQSPLTHGRVLVEGKPAAYVCRNYVCKRPVATTAALRDELKPR